MYQRAKYLPAGDKAIVVEFGAVISEEVNKKVRAMMLAISSKEIAAIVEMLPTYRSLMIHYQPLATEYDALVDALKALENQLDSLQVPPPQVIEVPTLYGGAYGPDIQTVAAHNHITVEQVIKIHSSQAYLIYMLGFTPGFPYLGGMDEQIATPRLAAPRIKIPAGSVGIAGNQTGIYPMDSPGGWQLIGRTPISLYDPHNTTPILLKAGDYIRFVPISEEEYFTIVEDVRHGNYVCNHYPKDCHKESIPSWEP